MSDDDRIFAICMKCGRLLYSIGPDKDGCVEIEPCPDCLQESIDLIQEGNKNDE